MLIARPHLMKEYRPVLPQNNAPLRRFGLRSSLRDVPSRAVPPQGANPEIPKTSPASLQSLLLLWLAYALVGWHLAAHHIFWFIGFAMTTIALVLAWTSSPWFGGLFGYLPQVLLLALAASVLLSLIVISPVLFTLLVTPILTLLLAWQEIKASPFAPRNVWVVLVGFVLLGLLTGELFDLFLFPSARY
ncbi:MAG: hypothetical protein MUF49_07120 [Oculatellaceae cyanobacterium Prado106]|nr:hypothetical protein [Oculatellaceae cyanobacterium Prado106]